MDPRASSVRDRVILALAKHMTVHRIGQLQYDEVALVDPKTKYVEAKGCISVDVNGDRAMAPPESLARDLEDYLNAQPPGRPFLDFRPDIGLFLFPSPRTGMALSTWALRRIIQGRPRRSKRSRSVEAKHPSATDVDAHVR
jgi:hypothetical protein